MSDVKLREYQKAILTVLRIAIGWHFLYEGVAKIFTPGWSAAPYLQTSTWIFGGFFRWIAATPWALKIVDSINVWGYGVKRRLEIIGNMIQTWISAHCCSQNALLDFSRSHQLAITSV
jgi:thiosulfate dehydrogenase [quinone] large subunit